MKVLSLFDGISCGRVALERAGFNVERYVAFEIDQDAINVSNWNYTDIEHRGSVEGADFTEFEGFDLVIGGFPCTDLSIGKNGREGLAGKHSRLFWEQVRAIKAVRPRYFLVENNYGMPKADEEIITATLGVKPIYINSALVSAQTRKRLYWTNIPNVEAPEDRGIMLYDILEDYVGKNYELTEKGINYLAAHNGNKTADKCIHTSRLNNPYDKSNTVLATWAKGLPFGVVAKPVKAVDIYNGSQGGCGYLPEGKFPCLGASAIGRVVIAERVGDLGNGSQSSRLYGINGKSVCLNAGGGGMGAKTGLYAVPCGLAFRTRNTDQGRYKKPEINYTGKSNALTTVVTDSMVINRKAGGVYSVLNGILHYGEKRLAVRIPDGEYEIRKLTPVECERLQTLPDGYTEVASNAQRYRQLGNGWTVEVIAHILNFINVHELL